MKKSVAKFVMTLLREFAEVSDESAVLAGNQAGNRLLAQADEKLGIAGELAAIVQRDGEFKIVGIEALAFGKGAGRGAQL